MERTRTRRGIGRAMLACGMALVALPAGASAASWYAGDGHVHTCYSHDAWCLFGDDNTGPETFYSAEGSVAQRFGEASAKGLHFLVVSDHNDVRAQSDPDFGSRSVVGFPAYEASLENGHAHMLGAERLYDEGDGSAEATRALADAIRAEGGLFQANHPAYKGGAPFTDCAQAELPDARDRLHWRYGYSVRPDTLEVWNATTLIQPSELYWECWLQRGDRIAGTAGSDSHGATQPILGNPTTWVLAESSAPADILAGLRTGRTTLSRLAPAQGGARLLLEGDRNRDGTFESGIGSQVPPGTPLRVRAEGLPGIGMVRVRANGQTSADEPLLPGGAVELSAPAEPGWVRATLYLTDGTRALDPGCLPQGEIQAIDTCTADLAIAAMTSPIYVGAEPAPMPETSSGPAPSGGDDDIAASGEATRPENTPEPDDDPPVPAVEQSGGFSRLPVVPSQRVVGAAVRALRARALRRSGGRTRFRLSWSAPAPVELQVRRGARWRTLRRRTSRRSLAVRLPARRRYAFRARTRPAKAAPGPWRVARARG